MGVPAFFRWLSRKYPSIVVHCVEDKPKEINGVKVPVDTSAKNPNDIEFDNLYLDMNGIIHPCTHPEDKPAPKNEQEMMILIFEYIDRIFSIVRPRRVLYMAIDGVAPRAKMNQQRSRRFRASKESVESAEAIARMREELQSKGMEVPPEKPASEKFDSNCITPGTPFMFRLADCLRFYIHDRMNNDPGWKGIKVILSDANVPGEGEHKIMDYIRKQRAQPDHDPNTSHCLCGADADLIMLGLATHEVNFTIIREEFKPNKPRPCALCGQIGHELKDCQGLPKEKFGEHDQLSAPIFEETPFIFLRLNVLREYLERELLMNGLPFKYSFERALDDWVFMCFFVGNDFLPHLPSLEIREGAIDRLVKLYKNAVRKTGGYLTDSGVVSLERVQLIMQDLGEVEDEIFKKRRTDDMEFKRRNKERRRKNRRIDDKPRYVPGGLLKPQALGGYGQGGGGRGGGPGRPGLGSTGAAIRQEAYEHRMQKFSTSNSDRDMANLDAAQALKAMMNTDGDGRGEKRKSKEDSDSESEPDDEVKLWEDGWKDRYYKSKFDVEKDDIAFRHNVANHYVRGLCWVLRYYYQGCASWKWYFPYHYAPFASDFVNVGSLSNAFEKDTEPFKPLEQLMGVFPAGSKQHVPPTWQELMTNPRSPIIDFYPVDFKIDLNGKKYAWQGVALLPFVDETRLWKALDTVYPDLTDAELKRNIRGNDRLFVSQSHATHAFLEAIYEGGAMDKTKLELNPKQTQGMAGKVWADEFVNLTGETVPSPLPQLTDLQDNRVISVQFEDPQYDRDFLFPAVILPGAKMTDRVLKPEDFDRFQRGGQYRPQLGFQPNSGYRGHKDMGPANRMISDEESVSGVSVPPPSGGYGGYQQNRGGRDGYSGGGGYGGGGYGARQQSGWMPPVLPNIQFYAQNSYGGNSGYGGQNRGGYSNNSYNSAGGGAGGYGNQSGGYGNRNMQSQSSGYSNYGASNYNQGSYDGRSSGASYGGSYSTSSSSYGAQPRDRQDNRNNTSKFPLPPNYRR
ncbi:5'-3' exoribonuclease 2-like isoform X3 [Dreissena polymorpha]|uniref:5'-3' exoribonuclease 2-like isoform X3 n=1 Tax=Dreissena polymorpha TaxID=45954 RepID=UPI0022653033|nr:5'-3' exoribonuclease 2-like isoform X3 [Dreissena polymorpha]